MGQCAHRSSAGQGLILCTLTLGVTLTTLRAVREFTDIPVREGEREKREKEKYINQREHTRLILHLKLRVA